MKTSTWPARRRTAFATALAIAAALSLPTGPAAAAARPPLGQNIKVNQVAYAPGAAKQATLISTSGSPQSWSLLNSADQVVASGTTAVFGQDSASGDTVHKIDFSSFAGSGTNFVLVVGNESSQP